MVLTDSNNLQYKFSTVGWGAACKSLMNGVGRAGVEPTAR
jgi:hypothetical protein